MKDFVLANLHLPDAGNRLDRAIRASVPEQVQHDLELSLDAFQDEDPAIEPEAEPSEAISRAGSRVDIKASNFADIGEDEPTRNFIPLSSPDPVRQTLGELRALFQEAIANLRSPGSRATHRHVPIGPYRLGVVASIRGKTAGQVAIQGMPNKQIEMLVPSFVTSGSNAKTILAAWHYRNNSLAITYVDNLNNQRYILWDPVTSQQTNYDDPAELNHGLYQLGLEVPDQLDRVLSNRFVPRTAT